MNLRTILVSLLVAVSALTALSATPKRTTTTKVTQTSKRSSKSVTTRDKEIHVDKTKLKLYLIERGDTLLTFPVSVGKNKGQKTRAGDNKTPEGTFTVSHIQNSTDWPHYTNDGRPPEKGLYGPWFFRLKTPMSTHIGIHGSKSDADVGKRASEGCVRLKNSDLLKLKPHVFVGMKVVIHPDNK